ncbi:bifunctional biotin--[acetyl-CoA-carboxylase] ligase/biotin operon repressor BirA [Stutzerimonas stutzeri]|uniref:bifunctional biotin--[acetyl-CoA-carboxylase] ligase/biotin operon repressor BirA n=1 Tax=Stutzerimonas stutzeri TaxID=316 RepID=UPI0015E40AD4|nr:bifunctional biotin--[acetyl-CoA-carboxylase] ligase/biotin operon repressor BirA [Stutzerimonas stutzeri]MBA1261535.1 bifunctional biotin--[acetyl-CoA-carboxylase] ligase/biotin operon repressor BirA [Stutzerimonas stutzeri]
MNRLLEILQDGRFHSGQELGAVLGISRSAVWKHLQRLEVILGIQLYKVPGRGYRLAEAISLIDIDDNTTVLQQLGWGLKVMDSTDSTNAEALRMLLAGAQTPFVVLAESQTNGRGRRGRVWVSPPAQNLYYTLALTVSGGPQRLSGLSLVVGLAVMQTLRQMGVEQAGVKWPNDIYAGGKKIAGILMELTGDPADLCHVVIGVGINVNMAASSVEIAQAWTSMRNETSALVDRNELVRALSHSLHHYLARHAEEGFGGLRAEWEACNIWHAQHCCLSTGSQEVRGRVLGVDDQGALRLEVDGHERRFSGGELSLRLEDDS